MSKNEETNSALDQIDVSRRGLLEKLLAGGAAVAALPAMSTVALGAEGQAGGKGKGGKGKGGKGKGGQGKGKGGRPDPDKIASMLIKSHDKDGDGALNQKELAAALKAMFSRRRQGQGKGKGNAGGKGKGKGKGKGENGAGNKGGVKPKKPKSA